MSLVSQFTIDSERCNTISSSKRRCGCARCRRALQENFSSDTLYEHSLASYTNFQSVNLTAPNTLDNTPSNLLFGHANKYISMNGDTIVFTLDITANLYVLNGNVFQKGEPPNHSYKAYLGNDDNHIELGELKKDGDGIYKLIFTSHNIKELVKLSTIFIVYEKDGKQQTLLMGQFS
jgi:hypothetical protein